MSIDFRFPPIPGAKAPEPQPLNKPRHNKAAQAACVFMKSFHLFDPENLGISDEGSGIIMRAKGFGRNLSNQRSCSTPVMGGESCSL